jgi:hypothetical protein
VSISSPRIKHQRIKQMDILLLHNEQGVPRLLEFLVKGLERIGSEVVPFSQAAGSLNGYTVALGYSPTQERIDHALSHGLPVALLENGWINRWDGQATVSQLLRRKAVGNFQLSVSYDASLNKISKQHFAAIGDAAWVPRSMRSISNPRRALLYGQVPMDRQHGLNRHGLVRRYELLRTRMLSKWESLREINFSPHPKDDWPALEYRSAYGYGVKVPGETVRDYDMVAAWNSTALVEALMLGIPVAACARSHMAACVALDNHSFTDEHHYLLEVVKFLSRVAASQFSVAEMYDRASSVAQFISDRIKEESHEL